ncbi:MAG: histidine phosphotransferase family protein [Pseudomonadota bacterium]
MEDVGVQPGDLPTLVASRICHDLISPLGAIGNGVELLGLDGGAPAAELALVSESVANASARLRFFRIAFGHARPGQTAAPGELGPVLADLGRAGRISYEWQVSAPVPRTDAKVAFLSILCLESALPYGGVVRVVQDDTGWTAAARGRGMRFDPDLWGFLRRAGAALAPSGPGRVEAAEVQFPVLSGELLAQHRGMAIELGEDEARLRF